MLLHRVKYRIQASRIVKLVISQYTSIFLRSSFILESPSEKFIFHVDTLTITLYSTQGHQWTISVFSKPRFSCNYQVFQIGASQWDLLTQEPIRMHHFGKPMIVLHQRTKLEMYIAYVKYELCQKIDPDHVTRLSRVTVAMNCTFFLLCHFNSRV